MGHVRTISQVDQAGQQSGLTQLEITYGGKESPFGGIDSSAPAAYIDPRCFADSDGFLIIDNKLVVASIVPGTAPTLWGSAANVKLLKIGTFYSSIYGQLNYALGYTAVTHFGHLPTGNSQVIYTFYITAWNSRTGVIVNDSILNVMLFETSITALAASISLTVMPGESADYSDSGNLNLSWGTGGVFAGTIAIPYAPGATPASMVTAGVAIINGTGGIPFTASPSLDGLSIVLTANTPGVAGNDINVADASVSTTPLINAPAFYFPIAINPNWTNLVGGKDATRVSASATIDNVSTAEVGGTLYIANIGPFILKYSGPNSFTISSAYNGQKVLAKFAGSLIGLGNIPQLGTVLQNTDMIFSWSSALDLDEWAPVDSSGFVTGAGFEQLADIADYLSGLIVSNNVAWIIRSQGISYAIATANGTQPYQINHIGLGEEGEGAQFSDLVCQYDQAGAFVGNSDIFQVSSGIASIGSKIKAMLFSDLEGANPFLSSTACSIFIGGDTFPIAVFLIGDILYTYNIPNQTWMKLGRVLGSETISEAVTTYLPTTNELNQSVPTLALQQNTETPVLWIIQEGLYGFSSISTPNQITFPQEELLFGRDVVIDALYIALWAEVDGAAGQHAVIEFYFNGTLFSSLLLPTEQFTTLGGNPIEKQVFPTNLNGTGVFTSHSPQLQIKIKKGTASGTVKVRISKIQEYASFEPGQRPV